MICKWCNHPNPENNKFCMNCGKELNINNNDSSNGNINNNQNINNNLYQANNNQLPKTEEKANIGLAILSFFIPLAGLIIFIVKKNKEPKTAKVSGICALVSFILNIIILAITFTLLFSTTGLILNNIFTEEQETINNANNNYSDDYSDDYNSNSNNDNQNTNDTTTSTNWKNYEITINNTKLTLPATYNDIETTTNASMKTSEKKSYLASNYYTLVNLYKNDKLALNIELTNNSENDLLYTDCQVTRVTQTKYQLSQGAEVIIFPGGLKVGDEITESKIIELFGTPYDTSDYSSENYESKTYKYVENTTWATTNNYEIKIVNGIIDELKLDNRN